MTKKNPVKFVDLHFDADHRRNFSNKNFFCEVDSFTGASRQKHNGLYLSSVAENIGPKVGGTGRRRIV